MTPVVRADSAAEVDLVRELRVADGAVEPDFRPFEIKTTRFGYAREAFADRRFKETVRWTAPRTGDPN